MNLDIFWVHEVTVETYKGVTGGGTVLYEDPVTVRGLLAQRVQLVRNEQAEQVISNSSFTATDGQAGLFAPKSRVTANGHTTTVITCASTQGAGIFAGLGTSVAYLE